MEASTLLSPVVQLEVAKFCIAPKTKRDVNALIMSASPRHPPCFQGIRCGKRCKYKKKFNKLYQKCYFFFFFLLFFLINVVDSHFICSFYGTFTFLFCTQSRTRRSTKAWYHLSSLRITSRLNQSVAIGRKRSWPEELRWAVSLELWKYC